MTPCELLFFIDSPPTRGLWAEALGKERILKDEVQHLPCRTEEQGPQLIDHVLAGLRSEILNQHHANGRHTTGWMAQIKHA